MSMVLPPPQTREFVDRLTSLAAECRDELEQSSQSLQEIDLLLNQTQAEVDRLWSALTAEGGAEIACGWLRDRWGVPWQIVPERLPRLLADPDPTVAARVFTAMQGMVKLDVAALERAAEGGGAP